MTPQLQQAIKLLQMSNLDLAAYVESELEQNPLLEREDPDGPAAGTSEASEPAGEAPDSAEGMDFSEAAEADDPFRHERDLDAEGANEGETGPGPDPGLSSSAFSDAGRGHGSSFDDGGSDLESTLSQGTSLRDHLMGQLAVDIADPVDRLIGTHLIDALDEAGYIAADLSPVAERLGCPLERVEATLQALQRFDPPGIFARTLAECLSLQLRDRDRLDPAMQALLAHLDLLGRRQFDALQRICGVDREDLAEMIGEIRALDPKPALRFETTVTQTITPDVLMRAQAGGWVVELNSDTLPRVLINNHYHATVSRAARTKTDRQYIAEKFQSAGWLVRSLHQRATTILKVASEIVRQQHAFFMYGVEFMKPLVLRDIAVAIEMHESTVSRVTSNKFIATPRGIYELKYFFTTAIASSTGGAFHSAESVRFRLKSLIDGETAGGVLSDDRLVDVLRKEGVDIARRTVAKYRESLGIPSSVQRRREKRDPRGPGLERVHASVG